jgi:FkbM family methyltransferase
MSSDSSRAQFINFVARAPVIGYPLLLSWQIGWIREPHGDSVVRLRDGRSLHCKLDDRTQRTMAVGLFEPAETRLVKALLAVGDTVIDVGAHIGWFATIAARAVGRDGMVIACEPYPSNAASLRTNLDLNDLRNVHVVEMALGARSGTLNLASTGGESGGVTALDWAADGRVEVPMATLDDVAGDAGEITLVKIDVEGWEAQVLRGGAAALSRTRNVLIEINKPALQAAGSSPDELLGLLRESGFSSFTVIRQRGIRQFHRTPVHNLLASRQPGRQTIG